MTTHATSRRGAALILALILLAGLLMLGLPFLFSQSASLAGTRSLAYQQQASVGRDAAEQLGIAVGAEALRDRFEVNGNEVSSDFLPPNPVPLEQITPNSYGIQLDTSPVAYNGSPNNARIIGSTIADEQGKLDVNHLDVAAWDRLLKAVGIQDWDDNVVIDSEDLVPDDGADPIDNDGFNALLNGDNDDEDDFGQLAKALARLRFTKLIPGQRITALDQLLRADTDHWQATSPNPSDYTNNADVNYANPSQRYGFRRPLTRAELDLLRPYLTVHVLAQGRLGLIDLGSTIAKHPDNGTSYLDSDIGDVVRPGTVIAYMNVDAAGTLDPIRPIKYDAMQGSPGAVTSLGTPNYVLKRGFAIAAPPAVNLHHALLPVRKALSPDTPPLDALLAAVETYAALDVVPTVPASTSPPPDPFLFLNPLFTNRELPPIDIASFGVIQIDSAAVANDAQGRSSAQRRRRIYAQAVPQEGALERHWSTQGHLHQLVVNRYGSLLDTWPLPVARVQGLKPDDTDPTAAVPAGTPPTGVRPKTMPSLASGWNNRRRTNPAERLPSHIAIDWKLAFGSDGLTSQANVIQALSNGQLDSLAKPVLINDLRPDGMHVEPGKPLGAFIRREGTGIHGPLREVGSGTSDLRGRHLSFWIKPDKDFKDDKVYPLLETRIPAGSAGMQMDGTSGFSELQNYLGVYYDRQQRLLVLVLAPPTIEHTVDTPLRVPSDDAAVPTISFANRTFHIDERCLAGDLVGFPPSLPLSPRSRNPARIGGGDVLPWSEANAKYTTFATRLLKPNRVVHLFKVADSVSGNVSKPFFRAERWSQIQIVLGGDRPGLAKLLVDGVAGRDVSRGTLVPSSVGAMQHGDHLSLPVLPLEFKLPMIVQGQGGGASLGPIDITVKPVLGLTAADLFPARGMLRIGDEFIAYESINLNTFERCVRGQRQNTQTDSATLTDRWPNTQQHPPGTLVSQGGYRLRPDQGRILRGGNTLRSELKNGDTDDGLFRYRIWAQPDTSKTTAFLPSTSFPTLVTWLSAGGTIPLTGLGVPDQFPATGGVILFQGRVLYYEINTGTELQQITAMTTNWVAEPTQVFPALGDIPNISKSMPDPIRLLSIELNPGVNPLTPGHYELNPRFREAVPTLSAPIQSAFLLQLVHPGQSGVGKGRVEWIAYEYFAQRPDKRTFIVNNYGWTPLTRGLQRTDFCGKLQTRLQNGDTFPPGTVALPVQCELGGHGHWLATGDVVTLRRRPAETPRTPIQLLVRYAAMDGYDALGNNGSIDTKNELFAFDRALPLGTVLPDDPPEGTELERIDARKYELLSSNCWSGEDLTPMGPQSQPRGNLPRLDLLAGNQASAVLYLGAADKAALEAELKHQRDAVPAPSIKMTPGEYTAYLDNRETELSATIDAVIAGDLPGIGDTAVPGGIGIRGVDANDVDLPSGSNIGIYGQQIESTTPLFKSDPLSNKPMGLIALDGEVFAYRRVSDTKAVLVGSGLLDHYGSLGTIHAFADGPMRNSKMVRPLMPALVLPIGPVAVVGDQIQAHSPSWLRFVAEDPITPVTAGVTFDAPTVLLCDRDGDHLKCEVIGLAGPISKLPPANGAFYNTATWLRGQYNTQPEAAGKVGDIAIGWWPRYPSALPPTTGPTTTASAEHFRSRAFSWASFPFSLYGARFDATALAKLGPWPVAQVEVQPTESDDLFDLQVRASGSPLVSTAAMPNWATLTGNALGSASAAFNHSEFAVPVDGAEMRVTWHYVPTPSPLLTDIANAGNRAPMLGAVRLRALAPAKVLAVEDAR